MEKIVIWGVKKNPFELWEILKDKYEILGWIDKNPQYHGKYIKNIRVYDPEQLNSIPFDKVIVGAAIFNGTRQIVRDCLSKGVEKENIITEYVLKTKDMSLSEVFELQHKENKTYTFENFNRLNLLIQYAFVEQFYGLNTIGYELAERYMKLVCEDERRNSHQAYFEKLIKSVERNGFSKESYISLNKDGALIDGTHRMAIALWRKEPQVSIDILNTDWNLGAENDRDLNWIRKRDNLFSSADIEFLETLYEELKLELSKKTNKEERVAVNLWEKT